MAYGDGGDTSDTIFG